MKKKSLFIFMIVICASLAMLTSCEYDIVVPVKAPPVIVDDTISYAQDIQPFFDAKCVSCHPALSPPDLTAANSYNSLTTGNFVVANDPSGSVLYTKCSPGGSMALHTSAEELALMYRWITAGAKNN